MNIAVANPVAHPGSFAANPVLIKGTGRPLVFLHGPFGQEWLEFHDDLATIRTVYAPAHPGSVDMADLGRLDHFWDLLLYYDDLFRGLDLNKFDLVGHSFGGMVAGEYAATFPDRVGKLVLLGAMGLWNDAHPVADHLLASPKRRRELRFGNVDSEIVTKYLTPPTDPTLAQDAYIREFQALASTSHFIHPIPERGLRRRLRRISAPTLLLWGADDRLVPATYAQEFAAEIRGARIAVIADAGHTPQLEQRKETTRVVKAFLD
jgi:pimeloyl-ACP methyl ester carboxylesterase